MIYLTQKFIADISKLVLTTLAIYFLFGLFSVVNAATLSLSPSTGVYTSNSQFTVNVVVNTAGQPVNAADGTLSFDPRKMSVVSVNRVGSIFNLWVTEPTFSNSAGTIDFSGGLPSGYTGQSGKIMSVTFKAIGSGPAKTNFTSGSVLANDGRGTNILTSMGSGAYTLQAASVTPEPEQIEYIAPANTPSAPAVKSSSHPDQSAWYKNSDAYLSWNLPSDVTAVRTLLNENPTSVPTKVYDSPISEISLSGLDQGVSYFHIQFRNEEGWGKVNHFRLGIDSEKPTAIDINLSEDADLSSPEQVLFVKVLDDTSRVENFKIKIDSDEPFDYKNESGSSTIKLPALKPGYHSFVIEAYDMAGNSIIGTFSLTILSFEKPVFTEVPTEINPDVIPVIKGLTRPNSTVEIYLNKVGAEPSTYIVNSDKDGVFIFIPEGKFDVGVYELSAMSSDTHGAKSSQSDIMRIAVQQTGFLRVGTLMVNVLSVIISFVLLGATLVIGVWYLIIYFKKFRKKVRFESNEALEILNREFSDLQVVLKDQESLLKSSRKTNKLTNAEAEMVKVIGAAMQSSRRKVEKEIDDITELTDKKE